MTLVALLLLSLLFLAFALVDWRGVRNTLQRPIQGFVALVCMLVLGGAAWSNLALLSDALQAYGMGVTDPVIPSLNLFQVLAVAITAWFAPRWLVGA